MIRDFYQPGTADVPDSTLQLISDLAESAAGLMISSYTREDWQDDPAIRNLEDVAMRLRDAGQEVPAPVLEAIECAATVR